MDPAGARVAMVRMAGGGLDDSAARLVPLARELAARGIAVDVLSRAESAPSSSEVVAGVTRHQIAAGPAASVPSSRLMSLTDAFGEAVAELAGRSGSRYDVIHAFGRHSGLAALPVALELAVPFVQTFSSGPERERTGTEHSDAALHRSRSRGYLAGQATAIVAASPTEVEWLIDEVHAPADRIWVIPRGVDVELFQPRRVLGAEDRVRSELRIAFDRPVLAVVGPDRTVEDDELAIRSLAELHSLRGWAPVLVFVGDDATSSSAWSTAASLGVADDVRDVGPLDMERLADLLAVATVAVAPAPARGRSVAAFDLVALESAASGTPVVAHGTPAPATAAGLDASTVLVASRDPRAWARTIAQLLDDQETLDDLSAAVRRHAEGFTWAASAAALLAVYSSL